MPGIWGAPKREIVRFFQLCIRHDIIFFVQQCEYRRKKQQWLSICQLEQWKDTLYFFIKKLQGGKVQDDLCQYGRFGYGSKYDYNEQVLLLAQYRYFICCAFCV